MMLLESDANGEEDVNSLPVNIISQQDCIRKIHETIFRIMNNFHDVIEQLYGGL